MKIARLDPLRLNPLIAHAKELVENPNTPPNIMTDAGKLWLKLEGRKKAEDELLPGWFFAWFVWLVGYIFCVGVAVFFFQLYNIKPLTSCFVYGWAFVAGFLIVAVFHFLHWRRFRQALVAVAETYPMDDDLDV